MRLIKIAVVLFLSQLVLACASVGGVAEFSSSEKNASYKLPVDSLKIFIDVSALGVAGGRMENIARIHSDASQSLVDAFKSRMSEATLVKPFGSVTFSKEGTSTTVTAETIGTEKMIAGESADSGPILVIHMVSWQTVNNIWNGRVGWRLDLVDPGVWTSKNKTTIWTGQTRLVQFSPAACAADAYKACADKFAESVVAQMRTEKIIQ